MRILFTLIGYTCVATVISAVVGLAMLWQSERMDDEKIFRMLAILYDIDVDELAVEERPENLEAPPEETSLNDLELQREVVMRDFEAKQDVLKKSKQELDIAVSRISAATDRFDRMITDLEKRLQEEGELSTKDAVDKVVRDLTSIAPNIAKDLLRKTLREDKGIEDVILLMNAMPNDKLAKILKQFRTEEEIADLHLIHQVMLKGGPKKEVLDRALEEIQTLQSGR